MSINRCFSDLPDEILCNILGKLVSIQEILNMRQLNKKVNIILQSKVFWLSLGIKQFGSNIFQLWADNLIQQDSKGKKNDNNLKAQTYRQVYGSLQQCNKIVPCPNSLKQLKAKSESSYIQQQHFLFMDLANSQSIQDKLRCKELVIFKYKDGGYLQGYYIIGNHYQPTFRKEQYRCLSALPQDQQIIVDTIQINNSNLKVINIRIPQQQKIQYDQSPQNNQTITRACQDGEAVGIVGLQMSSHNTQDVLGSSPQNSYPIVMKQFLNSQVKKKEKFRKKSGDSQKNQLISRQDSDSNLNENVYQELQLIRIVHPLPNQQFKFTGFWKGCYYSNGLELLTVYVDESEKLIKGKKLIGDPYVPSWQLSFKAELIPSTRQLSQYENERYIDGCLERCNFMFDVKDQYRDFLMLNNENEQYFMDRIYDWDMMGQNDNQNLVDQLQEEKQNYRSKLKIVGWHSGQGQLANRGYKNPTFQQGKLLIFNDDTIGFSWDEDFNLIKFAKAYDIFGDD